MRDAALMVLVLVAFLSPAPPSVAATESTKQDRPSDEGLDNRQKEAEEAKRLTELYLRNQSVFLRKGEAMIEYDFFYSRNSREDFLPVPQGVVVARNTRRFWDNTIIARYGVLTDGLEVDLIVPAYVRSELETNVGVARSTQREGGFGDMAAAVRYQVWYERGSRPSVVVDVETKSRTGGTGLTGTGTWNLGGGITLIKTLDPVVFFARLGYTETFASRSRNLGNIFDYRFGMGFSLNDRVSFNVQFTGAYIGASRFGGTDFTSTSVSGGGAPFILSPQNVEIMNLVFTTTVMVTKQLFIEPLVGVGLTEQSFTIVGFRIPYRF